MNITSEHLGNLEGASVVDESGRKIGKVDAVYLDNDTGMPEWVAVHTGLFGKNTNFVPLERARMDGGQLVVPFTKDQVKDAPQAPADRELSQEDERRLYGHYRMTYGQARSRSGLPEGSMATGTAMGAGTAAGDRMTANPMATGIDHEDTDLTDRRPATGRTRKGARDTTGSNTDDAMTRSEERLHVGTETAETGRARLRKYVTTENVTRSVPVTKERVHLEREPITDANRGAAMSGPDISEEETEMTISEERPIVTKETVPVERVRLAKDAVTEEEQVSAEVRKEQIDESDVYPTETGEAGTRERTRGRGRKV